MEVIRRLTPEDAKALWDLRLNALQLEPDAFGESVEEHLQTPVEAFAGKLASGGDENFVLGAFIESTLVGMFGLHTDPRPKRRHRCTIWGMFVAPGWRGKGIGPALLQDGLRRARSIVGVRCVLLSVTTTQTAACRMYGLAGFRTYGQEPEALQVGDRFIDQNLMVLRF